MRFSEVSVLTNLCVVPAGRKHSMWLTAQQPIGAVVCPLSFSDKNNKNKRENAMNIKTCFPQHSWQLRNVSSMMVIYLHGRWGRNYSDSSRFPKFKDSATILSRDKQIRLQITLKWTARKVKTTYFSKNIVSYKSSLQFLTRI